MLAKWLSIWCIGFGAGLGGWVEREHGLVGQGIRNMKRRHDPWGNGQELQPAGPVGADLLH